VKLEKEPTLADSICDLRTRKIKTTFFKQINTLLDWGKVSFLIDTHYQKGKSATEKPSYAGLLLFKMCLLQTWYGLSDYEVEDQVNDSISSGYFCGLNIDQFAPDHSTLSRFRTALTKARVFELLFKEINNQLETNKIILKTGAIIDASVMDTPLRPKGKSKHKVTQDREDEQEVEVVKK
jgi:IS5 family transposase